MRRMFPVLLIASCAPERVTFHAPDAWPLPPGCAELAREVATPGHVEIVAECARVPAGDG